VSLVSAGWRHLLQHWWRDNAYVWQRRVDVRLELLTTAGAALIQSTWGNSKLVAVLNSGQMPALVRNDGHGNVWAGDQTFGSGVEFFAVHDSGPVPDGKTSTATATSSFCVAMPDGTIQHWWRNNQVSGFPWTKDALSARTWRAWWRCLRAASASTSS